MPAELARRESRLKKIREAKAALEAAARDKAVPEPEETVIEGMRAKLASAVGQAVYRTRKQVVEPVFGQIKEARGMRRFSFRGIKKVGAEWDIICLTHNLLKLHRSGFAFPRRC